MCCAAVNQTLQQCCIFCPYCLHCLRRCGLFQSRWAIFSPCLSGRVLLITGVCHAWAWGMAGQVGLSEVCQAGEFGWR